MLLLNELIFLDAMDDVMTTSVDLGSAVTESFRVLLEDVTTPLEKVNLVFFIFNLCLIRRNNLKLILHTEIILANYKIIKLLINRNTE